MYAYNPKYASCEMLEQSLVGKERRDILESILKEMHIGKKGKPKQHWMIIGQKGMGKSHLLALLYHKVKNNPVLSEQWIPVLFPEELMTDGNLYGVLKRAVKYIISELEKNENEHYLAEDLKNKLNMVAVSSSKERVDSIFSLISEFHQKTGKHILLIAENLQFLLGNIIPVEEQKKLRAFLQTSDALLIAGSATTVFNTLHDHNGPFYNFFQLWRIKELSFDDMNSLVEILCRENKISLEKLGNDRTARLKVFYSFAGGNPRLAVLLADILKMESPDELLVLMNRMLEELTPYFLFLLEGIPPYLRLIINTLADGSPAQSPEEIAKHLECPQATVRNYLKRLKEEGYVKEAFSNKTSNYYYFTDYLYRIWFQMRNGRPDEEYRWLMELLLILFSRDSLIEQKRRLEENNESSKTGVSIIKLLEKALGSSYTDSYDWIKLTGRDRGDFPAGDEKIVSVAKKLAEKAYEDEKKFKKEIIDSIDKKHYDRGIDLCKTFSSKYPNLETSHLYWGICLMKKGNYQKAIDEYNRAIKLNSRSEQGYLLWGECLVQQGKYVEAIDKYVKALAVNPKSEQGYLLWGECLRKQERYEEAIVKYKEAVRLNSRFENGYLCLGQSQSILKNYLEAKENFEKALELNPRSEQGRKGYGESLWKRGKKEEAIKQFEMIVENNYWSTEGYRLLGEYLWKDGRRKEAIEKFNKMIDIEPNYDKGLRTHGECLWESGDQKTALRQFEKMVDSNPASEENNYVCGGYFWKSGRYPEAIEKFKKALEINPGSEQIYQLMSSLLNEGGKYDEAIEFFEKLMPETDAMPIDHTSANFLKRTIFYEKALKSFEETIYDQSRYYTVYPRYGQLLEKRNKNEGALLAYLNYIRIGSGGNYVGYYDYQGIHNRYIVPLLKKISHNDYLRQIFAADERKFPVVHLCILIVMLDKYDAIMDRLQTIISKNSPKKNNQGEEFDLLIFSIKLSIWLKLLKGYTVEAKKLLELYFEYIADLCTMKEKEKEVLNFCLDIYGIQLKKVNMTESLENILNLMKEDKRIPFNDVIKNIWECLSNPDSVDARKYMQEKPIAAAVDELKKMAKLRPV